MLSRESFADLGEARQVSGWWQNHYNHRRPHSSLGYQPPAKFAASLGGPPLRLGALLAAILHGLADRHFQLGPPRGMGLMLGVPVLDRAGEPDAPGCDRILEDLKDHGVLAGKTGPGRNVLTFMPPLTIDETQIGALSDALSGCLDR